MPYANFRKTITQDAVIFKFLPHPFKRFAFFAFFPLVSNFNVLLLKVNVRYEYTMIPGVTSTMQVKCGQVIAISLGIFIIHNTVIPMAMANELPLYDTNAYCREIGDIAGGSSQIELVCRQEEEAAKVKISTLNPSTRTMRYCDEVARIAGGSYQILEVCITDELSAEDQL
ncbi:hypothetical protein LJB99_00370 [Deltaproteobacteria bacterium OttesenSCG-928-K17]|nr:hypothetical protein [Deltaproteobacteria bacterium OttesenSCG-928-K17]